VVEGCASFPDSVVIDVLENPAVDLGPDISVCEDIEVILDPDVPSGNYEWQDGSTDTTYTPSVSGTYYVTVSSLVNECTSSDTVNVELRPLPINPTISGETTYCEGDTLILSTEEQADGAIYVWDVPTGTITQNFETITINNVENINAGDYTLIVNLNNCFSDPVSTEVTVNANPEFQIAADSIICNDDQVFLVGPADMETYDWSTGENSEFITGGIGNYSLSVIDQNGCIGFDAVNISGQGPTAAFDVLPDSVSKPGDILSFIDQSQENGGEIDVWSWNFGTGDLASSQNPTYTYLTAGVYSVQLTVIDENGCSDQVSHEIVVNNDLKIPDGFSPNNDGINDVFEIEGLEGVDGASIQIFNRWGGVVFESNDYKPGNFWDGGDVPVGTYFYVFTFPGSEGVAGPITINK
jgi:gliding motility-associated-like protein